MSGILCLDRDFFLDGPFSKEERCYSRYEAHLDLYQRAAHSDHSQLVSGKLIHLKIGEQTASERYLEKRWSWSRTKVRSFLKMLRENHELDQRKDQGETVLILCRYSDVTRAPSKKEPPKRPATRPPENQQRTTEKPKEKEGKEGKERKKTASSKEPSAPDFDDSEIQAAWELWLQHRREKRSTVTPSARKLQIKKINDLPRARALAMLKHSTENGYQGLFEPNSKSNHSPSGANRNRGNANGRADPNDFDLVGS